MAIKKANIITKATTTDIRNSVDELLLINPQVLNTLLNQFELLGKASIISTGSNLNDYGNNGIYYYSEEDATSIENVPVADQYGTILVIGEGINSDNERINQVAFINGGETAPTLYWRGSNFGTWTGWKQINIT